MNPAVEDAIRLQLIAAIQNHIGILHVYQNVLRRIDARRRRRRRRIAWVRPWIARRPQLGVYDRLMVELRAEDPASFKNFLRMPPEMLDELLERVRPRLQKDYISRQPLSPGLKLALTLRHFASGHTYSSMKFSRRVPHNTISLVVLEVCEALQADYMDEVMRCPTTPAEWLLIPKRVPTALYRHGRRPDDERPPRGKCAEAHGTHTVRERNMNGTCGIRTVEARFANGLYVAGTV
jgi:hypothetical protein